MPSDEWLSGRDIWPSLESFTAKIYHFGGVLVFTSSPTPHMDPRIGVLERKLTLQVTYGLSMISGCQDIDL